MRIESIQVGKPKTIAPDWTTSIYKSPIFGKVFLNKYNLEGDKQADLTVHGGLGRLLVSIPSNIMPIGISAHAFRFANELTYLHPAVDPLVKISPYQTQLRVMYALVMFIGWVLVLLRFLSHANLVGSWHENSI